MSTHSSVSGTQCPVLISQCLVVSVQFSVNSNDHTVFGIGLKQRQIFGEIFGKYSVISRIFGNLPNIR